MKRIRYLVGTAVGLMVLAAWGPGRSPVVEVETFMARGAVELGSIGALTFSPDGTLFVGDSYGGAVFALDLEEEESSQGAPTNVEDIDAKIAGLLGTSRDMVRVHDVAVSPVSRTVYLSVSRGRNGGTTQIRNRMAPGASPHLIRVDSDGQMSEVSLDDVLFSKASFEDVRPEEKDSRGNDRRAWNVLEMSFVDDVLYVSGMSSEEWSSKLRRLPYPFGQGAKSNALKIFHTAHGRYETYAPARVFVPYRDGDETRIFAGFSCTPLVDFSVAEMNEKERVEGKTIAELGAGNHVLDMINVTSHGETYFLLANHLHDFMRLALSDFDGAGSLTRPTNRAGIDRTPLSRLDGVIRLANDQDEQVVMLQEKAG